MTISSSKVSPPAIRRRCRNRHTLNQAAPGRLPGALPSPGRRCAVPPTPSPKERARATVYFDTRRRPMSAISA